MFDDTTSLSAGETDLGKTHDSATVTLLESRAQKNVNKAYIHSPNGGTRPDAVPRPFRTQETLLTLGEAAAHLNCGISTIRRAIKKHQLPIRKVGNEYRLSHEDLVRWTTGAPNGDRAIAVVQSPMTVQTVTQTAHTHDPNNFAIPRANGAQHFMTKRKIHDALGIVPTPHGEVIVRKVWYQPRQSFILHLDGEHLALRWMLPSWSPRSVSTRTQITPTTLIKSEAEIVSYYNSLAAEWNARLHRDGGPPKPGSPATGDFPYHTLGQIRALMTEELSATIRPMTMYTYNQQWDAVFRHLPAETQLLSIDRTRLQEVVTKLAREGLKPATIKNTMRCLGRLLIRAVDDGVLRRNPLNNVTLPKVAKRPPVHLDRQQVVALMRMAHADSVSATLFFSLGIYLGLRKAEIVNLKWEHLDLAGGVAQVINTTDFTTKSGRNRTVPICEDLVELLRPHARSTGYVVSPGIKGYKGKRYRFNPGRLFERIRKAAALSNAITPHVLRHTFASLCAQAGISLFKIGSWMGHTMSEVTEIYAHLAQYDSDIERLNMKGGQSPDEQTLRGVRLVEK